MRRAKVGLAPLHAKYGWLSGVKMAMSDVRADRTGPTGTESVEWKIARSRVTLPSTRSSYTTSAWLMPYCGRAFGSPLSIFTTSAVRSSRVP